MKNIIQELAKFIKVEDLMTKEVEFYDSIKNPTKFCIERDINQLPIKNLKRYMLFNKEKNLFSEIEMLPEEIIPPTLTIDKFIEKTRVKKNLFFVFEKEKIVGVIHFCDLINSWAYIYFYAIFHEFEKLIREILVKQDKHNEDFFRWYEKEKIDKNESEETRKRLRENFEQIKKQKEKIILPKFQYFQLRDLLEFMRYERIKIKKLEINKNIIVKITDIRNIIMHHKDISPRQNNFGEGGKLLYRRDKYDEFLETYFLLLNVLNF